MGLGLRLRVVQAASRSPCPPPLRPRHESATLTQTAAPTQCHHARHHGLSRTPPVPVLPAHHHRPRTTHSHLLAVAAVSHERPCAALLLPSSCDSSFPAGRACSRGSHRASSKRTCPPRIFRLSRELAPQLAQTSFPVAAPTPALFFRLAQDLSLLGRASPKRPASASRTRHPPPSALRDGRISCIVNKQNPVHSCRPTEASASSALARAGGIVRARVLSACVWVVSSEY